MLSKLLTRDSVVRILATMDDFLEYVKRRKAALRKELTDLESAERIYRQSGITGGNPTLPFQVDGQIARPTIKEGVIQLLEETYPMGLTTLEILDRLNRRWWRGELRRTSLSPQISRLKKDGEVVSEQGTWKLLKESAPPEGEASQSSGAVPERSKGPDLQSGKPASPGFVGSNPTGTAS